MIEVEEGGDESEGGIDKKRGRGGGGLTVETGGTEREAVENLGAPLKMEAEGSSDEVKGG